MKDVDTKNRRLASPSARWCRRTAAQDWPSLQQDLGANARITVVCDGVPTAQISSRQIRKITYSATSLWPTPGMHLTVVTASARHEGGQEQSVSASDRSRVLGPLPQTIWWVQPDCFATKVVAPDIEMCEVSYLEPSLKTKHRRYDRPRPCHCFP